MKNFLIGLGCACALIFFYLSIFFSNVNLGDKFMYTGLLTLISAMLVAVYADVRDS